MTIRMAPLALSRIACVTFCPKQSAMRASASGPIEPMSSSAPMSRNSIITRRGNCAVKPRWISTLPVLGNLSIN